MLRGLREGEGACPTCALFSRHDRGLSLGTRPAYLFPLHFRLPTFQFLTASEDSKPLDLAQLDGETPYSIMFGPDKASG